MLTLSYNKVDQSFLLLCFSEKQLAFFYKQSVKTISYNLLKSLAF